MNKTSRDKWMREVELSQPNPVLPDTVSNQARFWRDIISGKQHFSAVHIVVFVLVCGILATPVWEILKAMTSFFGWLFLAGCGALFLLLRWRVRKALADAHKRPPIAK
jgi:hypothetical protein